MVEPFMEGEIQVRELAGECGALFSKYCTQCGVCVGVCMGVCMCAFVSICVSPKQYTKKF